MFVHLGKVVIGEFAPLLFDLPFDLLPYLKAQHPDTRQSSGHDPLIDPPMEHDHPMRQLHALLRKDLHSYDYEDHENVIANGLPIAEGKS